MSALALPLGHHAGVQANHPTQPKAVPNLRPPNWAVLLAGALALAVAMGIGRFAFTPLLPLMMRDGLIDAAGGAELATANYLGYLLGALSAARLARRPLRLLLASLAAIVALTAGAALADSMAGWASLRLGAGVASAWAMVATSAWALSTLAARAQPTLGGLIYTGVGAGIALAGLLTWALAGVGARALWAWLALAALLMAGAAAWLVRGATAPAPSASAAAEPACASGAASLRAGWPLVLCYGALGFGYILPATFLPAMARALVDDPRSFGLAWPVFGLAALLSTVAAWRWLGDWPPLRSWASCQAAIGLGAALPLLNRSGPAIGLAALLVGGCFMVATLIALQQARALVPLQPAVLLGRMTAAFALGQIAGPALVRALAALPSVNRWPPIELGAAAAATVMLLSAVWLWRLSPPRP